MITLKPCFAKEFMPDAASATNNAFGDLIDRKAAMKASQHLGGQFSGLKSQVHLIQDRDRANKNPALTQLDKSGGRTLFTVDAGNHSFRTGVEDEGSQRWSWRADATDGWMIMSGVVNADSLEAAVVRVEQDILHLTHTRTLQGA